MKIAIIGAGLSGLTLATRLQNKAEIEIFEKSRGVGGRMTTRFAEPFYFDHGAQHFTAKSAEFEDFLKPLIKENIVKKWNANFVELDFNKITNSRSWGKTKHTTHFVGSPKMSSICKYLSLNFNENVKINLQTKVTKITNNNGKIAINDDKNEVAKIFDFVILTIPPKQALEILPSNFEYFDEIKKYNMVGCYSLMTAFNKKPPINWDSALVKNSKISWISCDSSKPDRNLENFCFLANSTNEWAENNIEENLDFIKEQLAEELQKIIKFEKSSLIYANIHKWRYANIGKQNGEKSFFDEKNKIGICGDWLIQARVESAFLSAIDLLKKL